MARSETTLSSRDRMIEAAIDLMRAHGLSGAGINDVVQQSGAPRGSLYHHFPDGKLQMCDEALTLHALRMQAFIEQALASAPAGARKVTALFEAFAQRMEEAKFRKSCAFGCVALDLDAESEPLRDMVEQAFASWRKTIAVHSPQLGPRGAAEFAGLLLTNMEGAYVRARAEHSGDALREAGRWLARLAAPGRS